MNTLLVAVAVFFLTYGLWLFYLAVMSLQRAHDMGKISPVAYRLGLPILYVGLALDFLCNVLVLSILVLEFPREWLVTARLRRLVHATDWRRRVARWLSDHLLNDFDSRGLHVPYEL